VGIILIYSIDILNIINNFSVYALVYALVFFLLLYQGLVILLEP